MSVRLLANGCIGYRLDSFRRVYVPVEDITDAPEEVKTLASTAWTTEVIAAFRLLEKNEMATTLTLAEMKRDVLFKIDNIYAEKLEALLKYNFDFSTVYLIDEVGRLVAGETYSATNFPFIAALAPVLNKTVAQTVTLLKNIHLQEKTNVAGLLAKKIDIQRQIKQLTETDVEKFLIACRAIISSVWSDQ